MTSSENVWTWTLPPRDWVSYSFWVVYYDDGPQWAFGLAKRPLFPRPPCGIFGILMKIPRNFRHRAFSSWAQAVIYVALTQFVYGNPGHQITPRDCGCNFLRLTKAMMRIMITIAALVMIGKKVVDPVTPEQTIPRFNWHFCTLLHPRVTFNKSCSAWLDLFLDLESNDPIGHGL